MRHTLSSGCVAGAFVDRIGALSTDPNQQSPTAPGVYISQVSEVFEGFCLYVAVWYGIHTRMRAHTLTKLVAVAESLNLDMPALRVLMLCCPGGWLLLQRFFCLSNPAPLFSVVGPVSHPTSFKLRCDMVRVLAPAGGRTVWQSVAACCGGCTKHVCCRVQVAGIAKHSTQQQERAG